MAVIVVFALGFCGGLFLGGVISFILLLTGMINSLNDGNTIMIITGIVCGSILAIRRIYLAVTGQLREFTPAERQQMDDDRITTDIMRLRSQAGYEQSFGDKSKADGLRAQADQLELLHKMSKENRK